MLSRVRWALKVLHAPKYPISRDVEGYIGTYRVSGPSTQQFGTWVLGNGNSSTGLW